MSPDDADQQAQRLAQKYHVTVIPIDTNQEYYSDDSLAINARESIFFVSREDPTHTAQQTERLLKYIHYRHQHVNATRQETVRQKAYPIQERIEAIQEAYRADHAGESPSLNRIAALLKEEKVPTSRGTATNWTATMVKRVMEKTLPSTGESR